MAGRRRRHRWTARLAGVIALLALPAAAALLFMTEAEDAPDAGSALVRDLGADGESGEVIECVLRLAERDLRVGALDAAAQEELVTNCRLARQSLAPDVAWDPPETLADAVQPVGLGDDPALDRLWLACEEGSGEACDQLFDEAPVNTAYEAFGLTCGDRPDVLDCAELDRPTDEAP
ncbi:MAG: hypothetical protein AAFO29_19990 [Actinomycetota bacterium]